MVELIPYNVYTTPFKDLPCLEDAIQKGYSTDEDENKTTSITVRDYPASLPYGIESLIDGGQSNYFSVVERYAVLYGVSIFMDTIKEISKHCISLSRNGSVLDLDMVLYNGGGIPFKTRPKTDRSNIYMPAWCKDWIQSNCRYLNLSAGKLATFLVICALNKSTILNEEVRSEIKIESEWFKKYLDNRHAILSDKLTK